MQTSQYTATTRRRPPMSLADSIRAESGSARSRYNQAQQRSFDESALEEQNRQFNEQMGLMEDQADQQQQQNDISTAISGAGTGVSLYSTLKDLLGGGGGGSSAASGGSSGGSAGGSAGGSSAGSGLTTAGYIAAIIAAQQILSNNTDTEFEGQRTGSFFNNMDQIGSGIDLSGGTDPDSPGWSPRIATEPWHAFSNDKFGAPPSAGEKSDALMYNQDWNRLATMGPATTWQWMDPVGDAGFDVKSDVVGNQLEDWGISNEGDDENQTADILTGLASGLTMNPGQGYNAMVSVLEDVNPDDSYLCGATSVHVWINEEYMELLARFYKWTLKNHHANGRFYMDHGKAIVKIVADVVEDQEEFYLELKKTMITPVIERLCSGDFEEAYKIYKEKTSKLFERFLPELYEKIPQED